MKKVLLLLVFSIVFSTVVIAGKLYYYKTNCTAYYVTCKKNGSIDISTVNQSETEKNFTKNINK